MAFRPLMHCLAAALVLLLISCLGTTATTENTATRTFLQSLATDIPVLAANWTGDSYANWLGVTTDSSGYVSVDLSNMGLTGELPTYATVPGGTLLVSLNLSHNPGLYGRFDVNWGLLSLLEVLDLSYTTMYGILPSSWASISNLRTLKLRNVQACGGLPVWYMASLQTIDLSNASLTGGLSASWGSMETLTSVDLSDNHFCGCVPTKWENSTVLMNAVAGLSVTDTATCDTTNACPNVITCDDPVLPTTTTTTTTTKQPGSASFGSAVVASCVTLATLTIAALFA